MQKTETSDWSLPGSLKEELEEAARSQHTSVADLLERIVREWLERSPSRNGGEEDEDEEQRQQRLRAAVMKLAGTIEGEDPYRAENASSLVRERIAEKYGR